MRSIVRQIIVVFVLISVLVAFTKGIYIGVGLGVLGVIATIAVGLELHILSRGPHCVDSDASVTYLGWSGTLHQFEIASRQFACDFMVANHDKLVNLSDEARSLLSARGAGHALNGPQSPRRYTS
jgi:hypothetical protein